MKRSPPKTLAKKLAASSTFGPPSALTIFFPFLSYTARRFCQTRTDTATTQHQLKTDYDGAQCPRGRKWVDDAQNLRAHDMPH